MLRDHLSESQRRELDLTGRFTVIGSEGGRYSIGEGYSHNVRLMDRSRTTFCAHPRDMSLPEADVHLAQMIMIEMDERRFRDIALPRLPLGPPRGPSRGFPNWVVTGVII